MFTKQTITYAVAIAALVTILTAGALYADKVYTPPEAPPVVVNTRFGPVFLKDDEVKAGDLITAPDLGTVYYLNQDLERVVFPDAQTFHSWYEDFSSLIHVSREKLESFPLSGRNATIRPGTYLVTIPSSPQVWVVGHPNSIHWMSGGEEQAVEIFGNDWESRVVDLPEYFFANYEVGGDFQDRNSYPVGQLVHVLENDQYYIITEDGQRQVTEDGFVANHLQKKFAIEREEPIVFEAFGPPLDMYEPKWGSPDALEQQADQGPVDLDVGGAMPAVS